MCKMPFVYTPTDVNTPTPNDAAKTEIAARFCFYFTSQRNDKYITVRNKQNKMVALVIMQCLESIAKP